MRILIVSFFFPPYSLIGAVRLGATAKYLAQFGHEVRVVSADSQPYPKTLDLEIPDEWVVRTPWMDVERPWSALVRTLRPLKSVARRARARRGPAAAGAAASAPAAPAAPTAELNVPRGLAWQMQRTYWNFAFLPDQYVGWYRPAVRAAMRLAEDWRPDLVFASGTPWTSLLVGREVASQLGLPFVAELRDPWTETTLSRLVQFGWRQRLDAWLERRTLGRAGALISVSEPYADELRARYDVPVHVVLNGFDRPRYERLASERANDGVLRLLYTGNLSYERDITPLLEAIALLGEDAASVRLEIVGNADLLLQAHFERVAAGLGVASSVRWLPALPHAAMAQAQRNADVLLLVTFDDPAHRGVYTGKLFEYVGARRPILLVGMVDGVAAELLRERGIGAAERSAEGVAARLRGWLAEKRTANGPSDTAGARVDDLTRESQTRELDAVLRQAHASFGAPRAERERSLIPA